MRSSKLLPEELYYTVQCVRTKVGLYLVMGCGVAITYMKKDVPREIIWPGTSKGKGEVRRPIGIFRSRSVPPWDHLADAQDGRPNSQFSCLISRGRSTGECYEEKEYEMYDYLFLVNR